MSRTRPTPFQQAELRVRCAFCAAEPGDWCVANERYTAMLHSPRYWAVWGIAEPIILDYEHQLYEKES